MSVDLGGSHEAKGKEGGVNEELVKAGINVAWPKSFVGPSELSSVRGDIYKVPIQHQVFHPFSGRIPDY